MRLTLLYGGLFLVSGSGLLAITYVLVSNHSFVTGYSTQGPPGPSPGTTPPTTLTQGTLRLRPGQAPNPARVQFHAHLSAELHQLLRQGGIALAIMTVVSIGLGWLVAGRVLRPLRAMTATTRQISEENLHERLDLHGPSDELKDLGDTIDGLLERLETAFDAQGRFVANASHELRTPLTMMRTSLDVAVGKPDPVPKEVRVLAGKLREGLDQADRLLESLLVLARVQQYGLPDLTTLSLSEMAAAVLRTRGATIAAMDIKVQQAMVGADMIGNATLLARMVDNVIDNAVRHNQPGGWIRVATEVDAEVARFVVESSGVPLDEGDVQQLGQPFRRLGAERTFTDNSVGLGLSIVAAIAAAHHGSLVLQSRPEGGLRVLIELPRSLHASQLEAQT
jgi:signal transduction histidine kinase